MVLNVEMEQVCLCGLALGCKNTDATAVGVVVVVERRNRLQ